MKFILERELFSRGPESGYGECHSIVAGGEKTLFSRLSRFMGQGRVSKVEEEMGAMHKHALPIEDASWLPAGCAENWETVLPHFWTAATVWAESAMKALRRMDREDLLRS